MFRNIIFYYFWTMHEKDIMKNKILGAKRLTNFDKPTVWSIMTPLAIKTKAVNLVNPI